MNGKTSNPLKELRTLREAVLAEEKARTQALLQNLEPGPNNVPSDRPPEETELAATPEENDASSEIPVAAPVSAKAPSSPPPAARPIPGGPAAALRNRAPKEPVLIIPLTPKIQDRLQRHIDNTRWSQADLVIELIRVFLHRGYPGIQFGDQMIARPGTYRTFERNPLDTVLKIISGQGVFNITVKPDNPDYQRWLAHFTAQNANAPEKSAGQVCLFSLQNFLESVEDFRTPDWIKQIPVESYALTPVA